MFEAMNFSKPYRIAIIGGGQLGKMLAVPAKQMGFHVSVLDPTPASPAGQVADSQIVAAFDDGDAIRSLAEEADVVTYEFEHIDCTSLLKLEAEGYKIYPTPKVLKVIQDKLTQKQSLQEAAIPVPPFVPLSQGGSDIEEAGERFGYPFLLKTRTGGYDGKGNFLLRSLEDVVEAAKFAAGRELMAEKFVPYTCEVSIMVARGLSGEVKSHPLSENEHRDNILHQTVVPARVSDRAAKRAREVAERVINHFHGVGIFCVEMFVTEDERILVNEVAPRPHNSGHYTIEACVTSQFEQHVRAITGLPLGDTTLHSPAVMLNLLGEGGRSGPAIVTGYRDALRMPRLHLHVYGKHSSKPKRKMGHLTVTADSVERALKRATEAYDSLSIHGGKGCD